MITFLTYYAQRNDNGIETWEDAVGRATDNLRAISGNMLPEKIYERIYNAILNLEVIPSMRLFSMPSAAIERCNTVIYNCSFLTIDTFIAISEMMYLTMSGVGIGYSIEQEVIAKLPGIPPELGKSFSPFLIEDSQIGWASSVSHLFSEIVAGRYPEFDYSKIRPAGTQLKTKGGFASGPEPLKKFHEHALKIIMGAKGRQLKSIELHDIINMISETAVSNGSRSGALICLFSDSDDDMFNAKSDPNWYPKYPWRSYSNNSMVTNGATQEKIDEVMKKLFVDKTGEPGLFNRDKFFKGTRKYFDDVHVGVNPCLTGDTLVHTVNGDIPIKTLADSGKDIDVFTVNPANGKLEIKTMRHPRVTGYNEPIFELTIENGHKIRATANHKFLLSSGEYKRLDELKDGDSLWIANANYSGKKSSNGYLGYKTSSSKRTKYQHRLVAEYYYNNGKNIVGNNVVHHKDFNSRNNSKDNLEIMSKEDHDRLHGERMMGNNNPMRRAQTEWPEEKWQQYSENMSAAVSGEKNGRFSGYSNEELYNAILDFINTLGYLPTKKDWQKFASSNGYPQKFSQYRLDNIGKIIDVAKDADIKSLSATRTANRWFDNTEQKQCNGCQTLFYDPVGTLEYCSLNCEHGILPDNVIYKACKHCGTEMVLPHYRREISYCSRECYYGGSKSYNSVNVEAVYENHKVISVEFVGSEDVYNGTVDDYHNFLVGGFEEGSETKKVYLCNLQCGEVLLSSYPHDSKNIIGGGGQFCNLTSVVVSPSDDLISIEEKLATATIIGTIQAKATNFRFLRRGWKEVTDMEALLGVSFTGVWDNVELFEDPKALQHYYQIVKRTNKVYANLLHINPAAGLTAIKPSGNSSMLTHTSPGANMDFGQYQIRNMRIGKHSKMAEFLINKGVPYFKDPVESTAAKYIFAIPKKSNAEVTLETGTAFEQLAMVQLLNDNYCDHNTSVTITYDESETKALAAWVREHYKEITGLAFFPKYDQNQPYLPIQVVGKEEYDKFMETYPEFDWTDYYKNEEFDAITPTVECSGERCDIVW